MATDDDNAAQLTAWLDGLAARPAAPDGAAAAAAAHRQGQRLRGALLAQPEVAAPGEAADAAGPNDAEWQTLLERARPAVAANETKLAPGQVVPLSTLQWPSRLLPGSAPAQEGLAAPAAERAQPAPPNRHSSKLKPWATRVWAAVGSLAVLTVLVKSAPPSADENLPASGDVALRGDAASSPAPAQWRSTQPAQDAAQLTEELRAAGAQVLLEAQASGVLLRVSAAPAERAAVNLLLTPLETALGADGQLQLWVVPLASTATTPAVSPATSPTPAPAPGTGVRP